MKASDAYKVIFTNFPDVVSVDQMCQMLGGISKKLRTSYSRIRKLRVFLLGEATASQKSTLWSIWKLLKNPVRETLCTFVVGF